MTTKLRAILFDLGETLVSNERPIAGAIEALEEISKLDLRRALVSDWKMPAPADSVGAVAALVAEYVGLVERCGLLPYFSPPEEHIALSTEVGVMKPDARIFRFALDRLGLADSAFDVALFVTENADHIRAARELGMTALRYGGPELPDWSTASAVIAHAVDASAFEQMLEDNEQVTEPGAALAPGQTHEKPHGSGPSKRRRFSSR